MVRGANIVIGGLLGSALLVGCGGDVTAPGGGSPVGSSVSFGGKVMAGGHAASGASVQLYQASQSGYGAAATALLSTPVASDSSGSFSIAGNQYMCAASSSQVYLVASGGAGNHAQVLLAALGSCGDISAGESVTVNEVTTVAMTFAVAPFAKSPTAVGTSSTNAAGLQHSFVLATLMADVASGVSPSSKLPSGLAISSSKIYSVANALAGCAVAASGCTALFAAATVNGTVPVSTAGAAIAIAQNPANNVAAVYLAGSGASVYSGLAAAPSDWTITMESTGGGLASPTGVAVDSQGRAWVANQAGGLQLFDARGVAVFSTPITGHGLDGIIAVAVDSHDNVWAGNDFTGTVTELAPDGTAVSSANGYGSGLSDPLGLAGDGNGNMWVVNYGDGSLLKFSSAGTKSAGPYSGPTVSPEAVTLDAAGTTWVAGGDGSVTHRDAQGNVAAHASCCAELTGIAIDPMGNPWVSDFSGGVVELSAANASLVRRTAGSGGISSPNSISVDGLGNVWVPNAHGMSVSEVAGVGNATPGVALSPANGLGRDAVMAEPFTTALDASGTLWVTSTSDNRLVRFIGVAAPVKTPLLGLAVLP